MSVEKIDIHDANELRDLNDLLERVVQSLNDSLKEKSDLKIILLSEMAKIKEIKDSSSFDTKVALMFKISGELQDLAKQYINAELEVEQKTNTMRQVKTKINSLEEILKVTPR